MSNAPRSGRNAPPRASSIAIIGGGQIGSRHLQALAHLARPALIYVVDRSPASLATAQSRFQDVRPPDCNVAVSFHTDLAALPGEIDVAIVATNADVRLEVLKRLLATCRVEYFILEKVLFQSAHDIDAAAGLLGPRVARTWVNCPRRMAPAYLELRQALAGSRPLDVRISGAGWGIGCNSIHFLDLIDFLAGRANVLSVTSSRLGPPVPARRHGFIEFTGSLEGYLDHDVRFSLTSYAEGEAPILIHIDSPTLRCIAVEENAQITGQHSRADENWVWRPSSEPFRYQSQLSHLVVNSLLEEGTCGLPTFEESARLHKPFLAAINKHLFGSSADDETKCPIT